MKEIFLTQGQVTQVSDWRFDFLNQWKWWAQWCFGTKSFYAVSQDSLYFYQVKCSIVI